MSRLTLVPARLRLVAEQPSPRERAAHRLARIQREPALTPLRAGLRPVESAPPETAGCPTTNPCRCRLNPDAA